MRSSEKNYTHFGKKNDILRSPKKNIFSKKSFFAFICQTIHISAKITIFWDHLKKIIFCQKIVFCVYLAKYIHFGKNNDILRSLEKNYFLPKKAYFAFICQNIHISANIRIFWDKDILRSHKKKYFLSKNCFLPFSAKIYTFRQK